MRNLLRALMTFGFLLIIGTAGASDLNSIAIGDILFRVVISFLLVMMGFYGQLVLPVKKIKAHKIRQYSKPQFKKAA